MNKILIDFLNIYKAKKATLYTQIDYEGNILDRHIHAIIDGDPREMTLNKNKELEDFVYINKIKFILIESSEEECEYDNYQPKYSLCIENFNEEEDLFPQPKGPYDIDLEENINGRKKLFLDGKSNKEEDKIKLNLILDDLYNEGFSQAINYKVKIKNNPIDFKEINKIVNDTTFTETLRREYTVVDDVEVSLYIDKEKLSIHFNQIGYNFNWNALQSINEDKYTIPITYSIIDKTGGVGTNEGYSTYKVKKIQSTGTEEYLNFFQGSIKGKTIKRLVLNKGKAKYYKKVNKFFYFFNEKDKCIFQSSNIKDPDLTLNKINDFIDEVKSTTHHLRP